PRGPIGSREVGLDWFDAKPHGVGLRWRVNMWVISGSGESGSKDLHDVTHAADDCPVTPRPSIRRFPAPTVTAFNVSAGIGLAGFNHEAAPSGYLLRPLLACLAHSVVIGA